MDHMIHHCHYLGSLYAVTFLDVTQYVIVVITKYIESNNLLLTIYILNYTYFKIRNNLTSFHD